MKKYIIDFILSNQLTAGPKAREDVNTILGGMEYALVKLTFSKHEPVKSILSLISVLFKVRRGSDVLIQYPIGNIKASFIVIKLLKIKNCKITILVHDLESLRRQGLLSVDEMRNLNAADMVVLHTEAMKDAVVKAGFKTNSLRILSVFDYLVSRERPNHARIDNIVTFAGSLKKAPCVQQFDKCGTTFNLYGAESPHIDSNSIIYKGKFLPDDMSPIEGDWGLVWDGESVETCKGVLGEYLKYNAPHKLSLYLAAGLPVIVWNQSAERDFVVSHHLGIAVDSLENIGSVLCAVDDEQYQEMKKHVKNMAQKIHQGEMLKAALS